LTSSMSLPVNSNALTNWDCVFQFSYINLNPVEREQKPT
jgi:hypothetical protein